MILSFVLVSAALVVVSGQEADFKYLLQEEKPNGSVVANIASDVRPLINVTDSVFSKLRYQLLTEGNVNAKLFSLKEQSGRLEATKIDREKVCQDLDVCVLQLSLAIFKDDPDFPNNPDLIKLLLIDVTVQDINDHPPLFSPSEMVVSVSETVSIGYVIPIDAATDEDSGANNSVQTYEFVTVQDEFRLKYNTDQATLEIEVNKRLNYEADKFYQLEIVAKDGGSPQRSGSVTIHVNVLDENDNSPEFTKPEYKAVTEENRGNGEVIVQVTARDLDSGDKGNVSYRFNPSSVPSVFGINVTSGEIYVTGQIDFESEQTFSFFVQAVDGGVQPQSSSALVVITVTDINDNAPQVNINLPPGGDVISEAAEPGRYIANVAVSDPDSGALGNVICQLHSDYFKMETLYINMYKVTLKQKLNREGLATHNISVVCADGGTPSLVTTTSFLIHVGDVNDNPPTFTHSRYNVSIYENNQIGAPVTIVTASDRDEGENGRVTYSLSGNEDDFFSINSDSGVVSTNVVFDREIHSELLFQVVARDSNVITQYSSTATVVVTILDMNDNQPSFSQEVYSFTVPENQAPGTVIGRLYAYDKDIGANGNIYFPPTHPYTSIFEIIQSTGQIQTKVVLDRETQGMYDFHVTAEDNGQPPLQTTTNVVIVVQDVNDNVPNVTFPTDVNNTVTITPSKTQGTLVAKVMATDPDLGVNSVLSYVVMKGASSLFNVNNRTGVVSLGQDLKEDHLGTYTILLAIQDSGTPSQTTWSNLVIIVSNPDANKNVIIVIAVISVTVTLSLSMIIMICLIRRQDGKKFDKGDGKLSDHKKKFVLDWLRCLSTSTRDVHKLGNDKTEAQLHRPTDLKPICSNDSTASEGSQDCKNESQENIGRTDEDEGFVETPGGTLSHDSGRGDSVRTRHDSSMSQQELMTSQDSRMFYSLPRCQTGSKDAVSDTRFSTATSDGVSIPESWQHRPVPPRPSYNRNISLDEQMLRDRQKAQTMSSFREDARFSSTDSSIVPVSRNYKQINKIGLGLSYDSHTLHRHIPGQYQRPSNSTSTKLAQKRTLSPISATPEPSEGGFSSSNSSFTPHPRSPSHQPYSGVHFFKSGSQSSGQSLSSVRQDIVQLESDIESRLNREDCIV
ncbi:protocadherin beta-16-like [Mizuhopecten yessoensis]|uniref:Protocadherin-9 n=1 Tax=Mizuhopecten yessoensis TaxID=6573 RepID=A0A210QFY1_MIZYE|nr:protocadherin beta-16-like [Mizuhopecten yessoensis]XP_021359120.1 protocadherin beta-16-like [Mizuhopecten yessoensis]XP_021359121.1 protocadherin beta-16-like [Mizuhopecten yessoensis]XP_021359123.1 protocadherin beta-16-like [Mizuhopecten yessoensis]XP_021359124.1 protocadherin beta-16-like [Mizuhopecten yessoensis]XP_021359125.1 protocadherin beta-16-like [Mizuhopecten yessoensis]XP_021359126.1 protocadherin beta-16-like [Mizuhopecten yessoensis]OWF47638.1 Protocadherin-9 [Mizuhopecte